MEGLTALFAQLIAALRGPVPAVCPGDWAWAVTLLGILVGLLPTVGVAIVAVLRRRIGSAYGVPESAVLAGTGIVTAGLLPLLAFTAVGRVFTTAYAGKSVDGLTRAQQNTLGKAECFVGNPARYLGAGSVAGSFDPSDAVRFGLSLVLLVALPLVVALFVAAQARLVLRRGPRWPSPFFWGPVLSLALFSIGQPPGATGHLWLGMSLSSLVGILLALLCGVPSREVIRRSLEPAAANPAPSQATPLPPSASTHRPPVERAPRPPTPTLVSSVSGATRMPGTPRFRLIRKLGAGGFGGVWLAQDATRGGQHVALKAAHAPDKETEERIRREFQALASIRHPHCVPIFDMVAARSDPGLAELEGMVLVMGFVEGPSLGELVRNHGVLDDVQAARVWFSLSGALDAAHRRDVMHRDVKPGNVIVDPGGLAHLIDFGIARRTGDATLTQAGFVLGTPDFLAPEVACGDRASPASDGWQLAATVSYALTGHPPRGTHPDAISGLRAAAVGAPLSHLPKRTAHLALLRATLDTNPARRPPLQEVERTMRTWLQRQGVALDGPVTSVQLRVR